jgi:hypothetical protein
MAATTFTPNYVWGDPQALEAYREAKRRQQEAFAHLTSQGRDVYTPNFSLNQSGSPTFGGAGPGGSGVFTDPEKQRQKFPWAQQNPGAFAAELIAKRGGSTMLTNPFTSFAVSMSEAAPILYDIMFRPGASNIDAQAPELFNLIQAIDQALRTPYSQSIDNRLTAKAIGDALRNYNLGSYLDAGDQAQQVAKLLDTIGRFWLSDTWVKAALRDLNQKQLEYAQMLAAMDDPTKAPTFIQYLASTGYIDRYFGT